jgi:hypothetical protein
MKIPKAFTFLFGAALLCSSAAIAGETNKGTLKLTDAIVIQGKTLNSGKYTVEWADSGRFPGPFDRASFTEPAGCL